MSKLSYLDRLLNGVDVRPTPLGEVAEIKRGTSITQRNATPGDVPVVAGGRTPAYFHNTSNRTGETIVIAGSGAYAGFVSWWDQPIFVSDAFSVKPYRGLLSKYCFYWLQGIQKQLHEMKSGGGVPHVYPRDVAQLKIPVPSQEDLAKSLAIQAEIVRILDAFTGLAAELTAELAARRKQYHYYREQLLSLKESEVGWRTLGEIGDVKMCKRIMKIETRQEGDVPFYKIGTFGKKADAFISKEIYEAYKARYPFPRKGDVLISASGTIGRAVIYDGQPAYFQDSNIVWLDNDESIVTNGYLWHFYKVAKWFVSEGGTIDRLYNDNIRKTKIPVPYPNCPEKSLAEQARIVAILDKFDALTNSNSEGLPREIELRQKQYAYYRDLLFNFPKPEDVVV